MFSNAMGETAKNAKNAKRRHYSGRLVLRAWRPWRFHFALLTATLIGVSASFAAATDELRVMSFNIRFAKAGHSEERSENNWADATHPRRERVIRVIRDFNPDLLGVQEARDGQISDLREALPEYEFYGIGRDDGKTGGEFSGIYYRKARFKHKDAGSFWLSATPDKQGTTFAPNKLPRIASWVKLVDDKSSREFVLLNMHWDHQDQAAREKSAALVRERLATIAKGIPTIVMGDLNSKEDSKAYATLTVADEAGRELIDSYRKLYPKRSPNEASFDDWKGTIKGSRIDFILHTAEFAPTTAEIVRTSYEGRWPSDHYPVTATLRLSEK
jgi:endonuclease/exonuclease/phosphatase family metal-dependent hydrolase